MANFKNKWKYLNGRISDFCRRLNVCIEIKKPKVQMYHENINRKIAIIFAFTPLHFRRSSPRVFDFSPLLVGIDSCHFLSLCFANNDAPVKHSRGAPARTAPNPPGSTCPRPFNLGGRMPGVLAVRLYRCCGAIRKDDLALIAPFNVERQLNLAPLSTAT